MNNDELRSEMKEIIYELGFAHHDYYAAYDRDDFLQCQKLTKELAAKEIELTNKLLALVNREKAKGFEEGKINSGYAQYEAICYNSCGRFLQDNIDDGNHAWLIKDKYLKNILFKTGEYRKPTVKMEGES